MSSDTTHGFRASLIGEWGELCEFEVSGDRIAAYAAATNDDNVKHSKGLLAPPVFAVVASRAAMARPAAEIVPPGLNMRAVHADHDIRLHRPIERGMTLVSRGMTRGVHARSSGVTLTGYTEIRTPSGELVVEHYTTTFLRGAAVSESLGEPAARHPFPPGLGEKAPLAQIAHTYDADQTYRYAAASGDDLLIHIEDKAARAAGLPGIIIQRLCTMAFSSRAILETVCPEDPTRLKRLAARFDAIALPGQTISTSIWETARSDHRMAYAYNATSDSGAVVIKDGLAEVARRRHATPRPRVRPREFRASRAIS